VVNPQKENGHIDIANEIADHLMQIRISGEEWQILWVIFRQTWGYCKLKKGKPYKSENGFWVKKKIDAISQTQFEKFTRIKRRRVWSIVQRLLQKNLITKKDDSYICKYGIQKDWTKWKLSPKKVTVTKKDDSDVTKKDDETVTKKDAHKRKEKKKDTKERRVEVFDYWKSTLNHPKAKLTIDREAKIRARLNESYSIDDLKRTVDGCKASVYHMGDNDQGKIYDSIELLFRNGDKVEQFWGYLKMKQEKSVYQVQLNKAKAELGKLAGKDRILKWLLILPGKAHSELKKHLDKIYRQGHSYAEAKDEWDMRNRSPP